MFEIVNIQSAEESALQTENSKKSLRNGIAIPFEEVNELLDVDWSIDTIKLVASFFNKSHAEGNFVYTGNMDNDEEVNYFDMVFRILNAFVITNPDAPAYPTSVLVRILSNSENQCFLNCVMSFMPEDFSRLNIGEVFLPDALKAIIDAAEKRYTSLT